MTPTQSNILVQRIKNNLNTPSGIILKSSPEPDKALVLKTGPDVTEVLPDQTIVLDWNHAVEVSPNRYIIGIANVIAIIE